MLSAFPDDFVILVGRDILIEILCNLRNDIGKAQQMRFTSTSAKPKNPFRDIRSPRPLLANSQVCPATPTIPHCRRQGLSSSLDGAEARLRFIRSGAFGDDAIASPMSATSAMSLGRPSIERSRKVDMHWADMTPQPLPMKSDHECRFEDLIHGHPVVEFRFDPGTNSFKPLPELFPHAEYPS